MFENIICLLLLAIFFAFIASLGGHISSAFFSEKKITFSSVLGNFAMWFIYMVVWVIFVFLLFNLTDQWHV